MPPRVNRPQLGRADSIRRYKALIEAATELFMEVGYAGASMDEVVARAGGSKSSIYSYFRDKEGLFTAVIDDMVRDMLVPLHTVNQHEYDLETGLRVLADETLRTLISPKGLGLSRLVCSETVNLPAIGRAFYGHGPGQAIEQLGDLLEKKHSLGEINCSEPHDAAEYFWGMLLHKPMLLGMCNAGRAMWKREREAYVSRIVSVFMERFTR